MNDKEEQTNTAGLNRYVGWLVVVGLVIMLAWFLRADLGGGSTPGGAVPPAGSAPTAGGSPTAPAGAVNLPATETASQQPDPYPEHGPITPVASIYPPPFQPTKPSPLEAHTVTPTNTQLVLPTWTSSPTASASPTTTPTNTPWPTALLPPDAAGVLTYLAISGPSSATIVLQAMPPDGLAGPVTDTRPLRMVGPVNSLAFDRQILLFDRTGSMALLLGDLFQWEYYVLDIEAGELSQQLYGDLEINDVFGWIPGGERLLISHAYTILLDWNPQTGETVQIARPRVGRILSAAATSDSSRVAYAVEGSGLYTAAANGSDKELILATEYPLYALSWSPDGQWLAYLSDGWYLIRPDGSEIRPFSADDFSPGTRPTAVWSPDSRYLLVWSLTSDFIYPNGYETDLLPTFYLLDTQTMRAELLLPDARGGLIDPAWSPDGRHLAFAYNPDGVYQIYTLTLADRSLRQVTSGPAPHRFPGWFAGQ